MRVTHDKGALRLRRKGVEDGVDRIGPFCLQAGVLLEAIPDAVFGVDRVIDLQHDEVLAVAVVQRPLPLGRAAAAIEQGATWRSGQQIPGCVQRAGCDRHRRSARSRQQREHIFVERDLRGLGRKVGACDRVKSTRGKLPQHILLVGGRRQGRWRDQRQCDANALIVGKEKELVLPNRPSHADAEFIHHVTRLLGDVARRVVRMKEIVLRVEQRAVPYLDTSP
jgi:hypothetical protein